MPSKSNSYKSTRLSAKYSLPPKKIVLKNPTLKYAPALGDLIPGEIYNIQFNLENIFSKEIIDNLDMTATKFRGRFVEIRHGGTYSENKTILGVGHGTFIAIFDKVEIINKPPKNIFLGAYVIRDIDGFPAAFSEADIDLIDDKTIGVNAFDDRYEIEYDNPNDEPDYSSINRKNSLMWSAIERYKKVGFSRSGWLFSKSIKPDFYNRTTDDIGRQTVIPEGFMKNVSSYLVEKGGKNRRKKITKKRIRKNKKFMRSSKTKRRH